MEIVQGESSETPNGPPNRNIEPTCRPVSMVVGVGFILLSALAFGSTPAFVQLAYAANIGNISLVAFRCLIAGGVLWVVNRILREPGPRGAARWRLVALGALLFGPQMWTFFAALKHLETSIAVAIVYIYPALVAGIVALRLRKAPRLNEILLLLLSLCGVAVIVLSDGVSRGTLLGLGFAVITAGGYALYAVFAGLSMGHTPPLTAASLVLVGAGGSSVLFGLLTGSLELPSTAGGVAFLALHGVVIVPIGLGAYYAGLRHLGAGLTSLTDTSQPAIAALIGVAFLGERLSALQGVGIAAIVLAVVGFPAMALLESRKSKTSPR